MCKEKVNEKHYVQCNSWVPSGQEKSRRKGIRSGCVKNPVGKRLPACGGEAISTDRKFATLRKLVGLFEGLNTTGWVKV